MSWALGHNPAEKGSDFVTRSAATDAGGSNEARAERLYELVVRVLTIATGEEEQEYRRFSSPLTWELLETYSDMAARRFQGQPWAFELVKRAHRDGLWLWVGETHLTMPEVLRRPAVVTERDRAQLRVEWDGLATQLTPNISITAFLVINKLMAQLVRTAREAAEEADQPVPLLTQPVADGLFGGLARGYLLGLAERRYRRPVAESQGLHE